MVIVFPKFLKSYVKTKRRAPAYSRALIGLYVIIINNNIYDYDVSLSLLLPLPLGLLVCLILAAYLSIPLPSPYFALITFCLSVTVIVLPVFQPPVCLSVCPPVCLTIRLPVVHTSLPILSSFTYSSLFCPRRLLSAIALSWISPFLLHPPLIQQPFYSFLLCPSPSIISRHSHFLSCFISSAHICAHIQAHMQTQIHAQKHTRTGTHKHPFSFHFRPDSAHSVHPHLSSHPKPIFPRFLLHALPVSPFSSLLPPPSRLLLPHRLFCHLHLPFFFLIPFSLIPFSLSSPSSPSPFLLLIPFSLSSPSSRSNFILPHSLLLFFSLIPPPILLPHPLFPFFSLILLSFCLPHSLLPFFSPSPSSFLLPHPLLPASAHPCRCTDLFF